MLKSTGLCLPELLGRIHTERYPHPGITWHGNPTGISQENHADPDSQFDATGY